MEITGWWMTTEQMDSNGRGRLWCRPTIRWVIHPKQFTIHRHENMVWLRITFGLHQHQRTWMLVLSNLKLASSFFYEIKWTKWISFVSIFETIFETKLTKDKVQIICKWLHLLFSYSTEHFNFVLAAFWNITMTASVYSM